MLLNTLTFLVAGITISNCFLCDGPGVVPAPHPNKFALCTYEEGDLVARFHPCPDGAGEKPGCVLRKRREAVEELSTSDNVTESDLKELSDQATFETEGDFTTKKVSTAGGTEAQAEERAETEAQTEQTGETEAQEGTTADAQTDAVPTSEKEDEASDPPTTESASTEQPEESTTLGPNSNETKPVECWYPGVTCASCTEAAFCVGTGTFKNGLPLVKPVTTTTCRTGELCVEMLGCVPDKNRFCTKGEFSCTDHGLFPDPYDCRLFHSCAFLNGAFQQDDVRCLSGAYDARTGSCGYPLTSATCLNRPVPRCKQEFEVGALPTNPSMYYVCVKRGKTLSPSLFKCPGGRKFTTALFRCM